MKVEIRKKFEEEITKKEKELMEREKEIRKKEKEMVKRVKRMVELESKIRESEINIEKIEIEKKEVEIVRKEDREKKKKEEEDGRERERLEKIKIEEEKIRLEKTKKDEEKKMLDEIMREQQRKMKEIEAQIKAMTKEVKTPMKFFRISWKVKSFVNECREYVEIKIKEEMVENQILWVLTCIDGGTVKNWKEIIEDNLKEELREYMTLEEFFGEIRKEFERNSKGKKTEEDREKGMDGFWNAVKGKEEEIVKKKPKVEVTILRIPAVERGSGFWKR